MKRTSVALVLSSLLALATAPLLAQPPKPAAPPAPRQQAAIPLDPTPENLAPFKAKLGELGNLLDGLRAQHPADALLADVEVYEKAGRWLLEFPDEFFTVNGLAHALEVMDAGIQRARALRDGTSPWLALTHRVHAYRSAVDGSVQPYGVTVPASYDGTKPVRLYVFLHGRSTRLTEADFLYGFARRGADTPLAADIGQIQLAVYGRWNSVGYHFAGEADVFEALTAVRKRYNIDPKRILLRGFSMGGEGAWHIAFHRPDLWAAAEIGAGTWSRRGIESQALPDFQRRVLRIWENIPEWALNAVNLPLAAHDGENDGRQLESSIKAREQLAKEGFPSVGEDPFDLHTEGTSSIFMISKKTGHGTTPEVRTKLDAFLKEHGDRGLQTPNRIRFVTYTTRYNTNHWVSVDALAKHYERADVDADRGEDAVNYHVTTHNITRLTLSQTDHARKVVLDGRELQVKPAPSLTFERSAGTWRLAPAGARPGLHKVHALQGPIEDAFLDSFLCVRPTGIPWNEAVNRQALRTLARFSRHYSRFLRAHLRVVDDQDLAAADFAKHNVILFGDPGSNRWIARLLPKLPLRWTRASVGIGPQVLPSAEHLAALVYPSPLGPGRYVVLNTGLTIDDKEYRDDYGMPHLGDYAVLKVRSDADIADVAYAGLFDEAWQVPKSPIRKP